MCEAFCAAIIFTTLCRAIKKIEGEGLVAGPFHVLLTHRGRETKWLLTEAGVVFVALDAWLMLALVSLDPLRVPAFLVASLTGAGVASLVPGVSTRTKEGMVPTAKEPEISEFRSLSGPLLIPRLQWRRRVGPFPAWIGAIGLAVIGGLATALAVRNNADPNVGSGVLGILGLIGGLIFASLDLGLLRFAGQEPGSLSRLIMNFAFASPVVVTMGILLIGTLAGLPPRSDVTIAIGVGTMILLYSTTILLHALGEASRFPVFAAGIDLTIVLVIAVIFAPLALVWTVARGAILARSAQRLRWRER